MDPDKYNYNYLVLLHFLVKPDDIPFLGWTLKWTLKAVPDIPYHFIFFSNFLVSIWLFLDRLPYLEMDPGPCKCSSISSPTMGTIPQIFLIFWVFCSYFWIDYHVGHWTLNPENVTHHHHHHPPIFPYFLAIFWLFLNRLPYLDLDPGP